MEPLSLHPCDQLGLGGKKNCYRSDLYKNLHLSYPSTDNKIIVLCLYLKQVVYFTPLCAITSRKWPSLQWNHQFQEPKVFSVSALYFELLLDEREFFRAGFTIPNVFNLYKRPRHTATDILLQWVSLSSQHKTISHYFDHFTRRVLKNKLSWKSE